MDEREGFAFNNHFPILKAAGKEEQILRGVELTIQRRKKGRKDFTEEEIDCMAWAQVPSALFGVEPNKEETLKLAAVAFKAAKKILMDKCEVQ